MQTSARRPLDLVDVPHHDGSALYLPEPPTRIGQNFEVWLRAPHAAGVTKVSVRQVLDGEPVSFAAYRDHSAAGADWWRATLTQHNPVINYRFLTDAGPQGFCWITAAGAVHHEPTDAGDFRSSIYAGGPSWLTDAVVYQIFPDRFARSGRVDEPLPSWAVPASWDDAPIYSGRTMPRQFFGGDLFGVTEHLDHLVDLGVTVLYLTPVFPAPSNHRYNAATFDRVDPLLGGDGAYQELIAAAHARGLRVIGDFTTNHTGSTHDWFLTAQGDPDSTEAGFYFFDVHPDDYVGWFGVRGLPKVNHANAELRRRMITGADSPLRRYLRPPFGLDGWRIDVANMTGRSRADDVNREVARDVRTAVLSENPDAWVVGEHFHDYREDMRGSGWHGVMNYAGFTKPLWTWLVSDDVPMTDWMGIPWDGWPQLPGEAVQATMQEFTAVPWQTLCAGMTLVSSHDTPRIATITSDLRRTEVAVAAMITYPGVPMVFSGDEIGLEGVVGEDARRPFPWQDQQDWNESALALYRRLISVRAESSALRSGSLRWVYADADRLAYVRQDADEMVLVWLARAAGEPVLLSSSSLGLQEGHESDTLYADVRLTVRDGKVRLPRMGPGVLMWRWCVAAGR